MKKKVVWKASIVISCVPLFITFSVGLTPPQAMAASGTPAGNANCPHGFNGYTWASDMCYWGNTTYQVAGTVGAASGVGLPPGNNYSAYVRWKVTMYVGSPCTNFLEGGIEALGEGNGTETIAQYVYGDANGNYETYYTGNGNVTDYTTVYWYQGTSELGMNFGSFDPSHPLVTLDNAGAGGCYNEAGAFIASTSTNLGSIVDEPEYISSVGVWWNGGNKQSFTTNYQVRDNPCGSSHCMNGTYFDNGTQWASGRG